MQVCK